MFVTQKAKLTPASPRAPVTKPQGEAPAPALVRSAAQLGTVAAHALLKAVEANAAAVLKATLAAPARMPKAAQVGTTDSSPAPKPAPRARQKAADLDTAQVIFLYACISITDCAACVQSCCTIDARVFVLICLMVSIQQCPTPPRLWLEEV